MVAYTYFSHRFGMRAKGKGWRLDYYLVRAPQHCCSELRTCSETGDHSIRPSTAILTRMPLAGCRGKDRVPAAATVCLRVAQCGAQVSDAVAVSMQVSEDLADRVRDCYHLNHIMGR